MLTKNVVVSFGTIRDDRVETRSTGKEQRERGRNKNEIRGESGGCLINKINLIERTKNEQNTDKISVILGFFLF